MYVHLVAHRISVFPNRNNTMQCRSANFNKSTLEDIDKQSFLLLDIQHGKEMSRNQKHLIKKKKKEPKADNSRATLPNRMQACNISIIF